MMDGNLFQILLKNLFPLGEKTVLHPIVQASFLKLHGAGILYQIVKQNNEMLILMSNKTIYNINIKEKPGKIKC